MKDKIVLWLKFVFFISLFVIGFGIVDYFSQGKKSKSTLLLPVSAENVIDLGNNWYSFDVIIKEKTVTVIQHFDDSILQETLDNNLKNDWQDNDL